MEIQVRDCPPGTIGSRGFSDLKPRTLAVAASAHLDLIRAAAAWAVMWGHLRALFFVDFQQIQHSGPIVKGLYFLTGFGHQAVMVFFVLSGFLISSTVISSQISGARSWRDYAINRSSRLYVVLIPGLLFGLLWDRLGSALFASTGLYSHPLQGFGSAIAQNQLTYGAFFGNMFFLQTIACSTFGSNGPLWSLANEFWYYALFPVALVAGLAWAKQSLRRAIPLTILAFGLAVFLGWEKIVGFFVWMAGCLLVIAHSKFQLRSGWRLVLYTLASSLAFAACLAAARTGRLAAIGTDLPVGITFTLFLFGVLHMDFGDRIRHYPSVSHLFAGFSYSLYVLHFPLLLFVRAWVAPPQRWQPDIGHICYGALVGVTILSFAWLVSVFTENKTHVVRAWMRSFVLRLEGESS